MRVFAYGACSQRDRQIDTDLAQRHEHKLCACAIRSRCYVAVAVRLAFGIDEHVGVHYVRAHGADEMREQYIECR